MTMFLVFLAGCIAGPIVLFLLIIAVLHWAEPKRETFTKRMSGEMQ